MRAKAQPKLFRRIRWTPLVGLGVVAVAAFALHMLLNGRDVSRFRAATVCGVTEALAAPLCADRSWSSAELDDALRRVVDHPLVVAAAVVDGDGRRRGAAARDDAVATVLAANAPETSDDGRAGAAGVDIVEPADSPFCRASVRLVDGAWRGSPIRLDLLFRLPDSWGGASSWWRFCVAIGIAAALVGVAVACHVEQRVVQPLRDLVCISMAPSLGGGSCSGDEAGRDPFAIVAQALHGARQSVQKWRRRERTLSRSVDRRVEQETREARIALRRVRREAEADPLTGVYNRRMLEQKLPSIFEAQRSAGGDLSVVMIDIDHFKLLNDRLGHRAGDELLVFAGELIRQCLGRRGIAVRYGGDEFVLILPGISHEEAAGLADRIVKLFSQRTRLMGVQPPPTLSAGVASLWNNGPTDAGQLLELADRALYRVKQARRRPRASEAGLSAATRH